MFAFVLGVSLGSDQSVPVASSGPRRRLDRVTPHLRWRERLEQKSCVRFWGQWCQAGTSSKCPTIDSGALSMLAITLLSSSCCKVVAHALLRLACCRSKVVSTQQALPKTRSWGILERSFSAWLTIFTWLWTTSRSPKAK